MIVKVYGKILIQTLMKETIKKDPINMNDHLTFYVHTVPIRPKLTPE